MDGLRVRRAARRGVSVRHSTPPRPLGAAAELLALQRTAGNRAVTRVILQRRAAQELIDKKVPLATPRAQLLDDEIVPIGDAAGRFDGFADQADAVKLATGSPEVTVIVSDGKRFHVLRSTATTLGGKATAPTLPKGWTVVEVKEPTDTAPADAFARDYQAARDSSGDDQVTRYRRLLVRGTHLELDETAWSTSDQRYVEGKVNVALWLPVAGRHLPPKVVPTGSDTLPRTAILIGQTPFSEGPLSLRTTLLHEMRHAYHRTQTRELVEAWRRVRKADTEAAWELWLRGRKKTLPLEIYETTKAATDLKAGKSATETYSYLHGFVYRFRRDDDAAADPATMDAATKKALHGRMIELYGVGEYWESAGQDVQDATLDELAAFAATLTPHHRQHLREFMIANAKGAGAAPRVFYARFAKRL